MVLFSHEYMLSCCHVVILQDSFSILFSFSQSVLDKAHYMHSRNSPAEYHNLNFWYDLQQHRCIDARAADAALLSVRHQLWYLTPELVILSIFDNEVSDVEKGLMAHALMHIPKPHVFVPGKPGQPEFNPCGCSSDKMKAP